MRASIMEVDLDKFQQNINNIQAYVKDKKLMPVVKANAYGTYINKCLDIINQFDIVAVAFVDEASEIRKIGYEKDIFVLNEPYSTDLQAIIDYHVTIGLSDRILLSKIKEYTSPIKVHLEIETGMNRTGIFLSDLEDFIKEVKETPNIIVEGVYTHLSSADYDQDYTIKQLETFRNAVEIVKKSFDTIKYIHSQASNGLLNFNDGVSNLVRPGLIMYGFEPFDGASKKIMMEPICKLKTKVVFIKELEEGESISYSRKYITNKKTRVATIQLGYADGLRRELSNKGSVVINGKLAPILGSVCMDSCMVDVTDIDDVHVDTDVYIWDNEHIKLDDIANICNTINYEILSTISYRVPRVFFKSVKEKN